MFRHLVLFPVFFIAFFAVGNVRAIAFQGFISDCLDASMVHHTASLSIKPDGQVKPQADTETYIFVCISGGGLSGTRCTTGYTVNGTLYTAADGSTFRTADDVFGNITHLEELRAITKDKSGGGEPATVGGVDGGINPRLTNANGSAFVTNPTWTDVYEQGVDHQYSWLQKDNSAGLGGAGAGTAGAQQQATFDFAKITAGNKECAKINWDPRGYVFDAKTLHPVKGVAITLFKGDPGGAFAFLPPGLGIVNPQETKQLNGQYNFFVEPGYYKLEVSSPHAAIADLGTVDINYEKLFLNSLDATERLKIYQKDQEVQEVAGKVAIAHIPVTLTNTSLLINSLQVSPPGRSEDNGKINIFGQVSHPKTKIKITRIFSLGAGSPVTMDEEVFTNDLGEYDKYINQLEVNTQGNVMLLENLKVEFFINSFYTSGTFSRNTNVFMRFVGKVWDYFSKNTIVSAASSTSFNIKPIPTYVEGVAYDTKGKAIPGAIVGVYTTFSNNPMKITVADEEGKFKIGSQHLPRFEYEFRYRKPTGEVIVVDTGTFIKQNTKLLAASGVNPFAEKQTTIAEDKKVQELLANNGPEPNLDLKPAEKNKKNSTSDFSSARNPSVSSVNSTKASGVGAGMQGVIMIVVVILVLLMIGVGAFMMMKSKQQSTPQY